MVRNEAVYQKAVALRGRGFTLEEIADLCGVAKSTISKWLKNNTMSGLVTKQNKTRAGKENAKRLLLMSKARKTERASRYQEVLRSAETEFTHYKQHPLFIAGLVVYATAGDQTSTVQIRLATHRKNSHVLFLRFAETYLGVYKADIHFWLLLNDHHHETLCMRRWHKATKLPYSQFYKTQVLKTAKRTKTLHDGVGNTIIGSTVLNQKLNRWIELMGKELSKR